jgi:hypothetical protein
MRFLFALLIAAPLAAPSRIVGDVSIRLRDSTLHAALRYDYVALDDVKTIDLLINKSFSVPKASCPVCGAHRIESDDPAILHIDLTTPAAKGTHLPLTLEYEGSIADSYKSDVAFLELGLDDFWYPVHPRIGESDFTYRLNVRVDEPRFAIVTNGVATKRRHGWLITSRVPDMDIGIILGRNLDRIRDGGIEIVTKNVPPEIPKQLVGDMRRVLDFYNTTFGASSPERAVTGVFRPHVSRPGQGGYFRKGYFVLPPLTGAAAMMPNIAHELAHHWWIHAGQQNAWLNESFAEYSAMMAMRQLRGQAAFDAMIEEKRKRIANLTLPAIYGFDRTKDRRSTPMVFYVKGPLLLNALEKEIGQARFNELLRRAVEERIVDTDSFVALVGRIASPAVADDFLHTLKE